MLSAEIPKSVSIIVKSGELLEYSVPGSKITAKSRKWCVVFIGGKTKMVTESVEDQNGCPTWNSEVSIDLLNPVDPVVMLVLDGDKHHIGQVVIPLVQIPRNGPPNFDHSRLHHSNLEPTKKNSMPRGKLTYWIWATSYWPPGTKMEGKSKSIRSSLANLKRSKSKSSRAPSMVSGAYSESNLSADNGYLGGGGVGGSALWTGPHPGYSPQLGAPRASYNPLAGMDDNASIAGGTQGSIISGRPPIYQPSLYSESLSGSVVDVQTKKRKGILKKMRRSLSQSSHGLKAIAKKAGGDKLYSDTGSVISVSQSNLRPTLPDSTSTIIAQMPNGSNPGFQQQDHYFPDNFARSSPAPSTVPGPQTFQTSPSKSELPGLSNRDANNKERLSDSPLSSHETNVWGMHPEERGKKPLEEMSHRELVNYAMQLERTAQVTRAELTRIQSEREELAKKSTTTEQDLDSVRLTLADLRVRLLTAGLTEFLERPSGEEAFERKSSMSLGLGQPVLPGTQQQQSFLDRLTALTTNQRKLGGSADVTMPVTPATTTTTSTDWW